MKSHRSRLRPAMILLALIISVALVLQYGPIMQRVYALATLADADKIASSFMSLEESVPVSLIASSSVPHRFAESVSYTHLRAHETGALSRMPSSA